MKRLAAFLLFGAVLLFNVQVTQAHVLMRDTKNGIAAVLHINPDDDPIAGQYSTLYFDMQTQNSRVRIPVTGYDVIITGEDGVPTTARSTYAGNTIIVKYIFPSQGLYKLEVKPGIHHASTSDVYLSDSLRVSRGTGASTSRQFPLAQAGITFSLIGAAALGTIALRKRRTIYDKSTW